MRRRIPQRIYIVVAHIKYPENLALESGASKHEDYVEPLKMGKEDGEGIWEKITEAKAGIWQKSSAVSQSCITRNCP